MAEMNETPRPAEQPPARPEMVVVPKAPTHEGQLRLPRGRELRDLPIIRSQEQWNRMTTWDIDLAIEHGKITDPRVLLVRATKERDQSLLIYKDEKSRAEIEARYKPLIEGDRQALANFCLDEAQPHLDYCHNRAEVDIAYHRAHPDQTDFNVSDSIKAGSEHYQSAAFWQEMAAKITAEKEGRIQPQTDAEAKEKWDESPFTNEQMRTVGYLREHPTQPDALRSLQHLDADSLQTLIETLQQVKVNEALQAEGEPKPSKSDLIDLLLALIQGVKDGTVAAAKHVLTDNQQHTR
jgi:hypothetical protein